MDELIEKITDLLQKATDFPNQGDDKKVSLRNSKFPQFDYDFAVNIKENYPDIWGKGGNEFGNTAFLNWGKVRKGEETDTLNEWIVRRERFMERHEKDFRIAGVVAVMKWGGIVEKGEKYMKDLINTEKDKDKQFDDVLENIKSISELIKRGG